LRFGPRLFRGDLASVANIGTGIYQEIIELIALDASL
jgi:hypothetical protein